MTSDAPIRDPNRFVRNPFLKEPMHIRICVTTHLAEAPRTSRKAENKKSSTPIGGSGDPSSSLGRGPLCHLIPRWKASSRPTSTAERLHQVAGLHFALPLATLSEDRQSRVDGAAMQDFLR